MSPCGAFGLELFLIVLPITFAILNSCRKTSLSEGKR